MKASFRENDSRCTEVRNSGRLSGYKHVYRCMHIRGESMKENIFRESVFFREVYEYTASKNGVCLKESKLLLFFYLNFLCQRFTDKNIAVHFYRRETNVVYLTCIKSLKPTGSRKLDLSLFVTGSKL